MTEAEIREREMLRLVRGGKLEANSRYGIVAARMHDWLSVIVAQYADGEIWVSWCDGPRAEAETVATMREAMQSFASELLGAVNDDAFGTEVLNGTASVQAQVLVTVRDGEVASVQIIPSQGPSEWYADDDVRAIVDTTTWKPLLGLPVDVIWEA